MFDMIETLRDVLAGSRESCQILADWLEDTHQGHPEFEVYVSRLRKPTELRLQTLIDVIVKFGVKKQRAETAKLIRDMLRDKSRNNSKGTIRAYMKKKWSLNSDWFAVKFLKEKLDVPALLKEREVHDAILRERNSE